MSLLELRDLKVDYTRPDGSSWTVLDVPDWKCEEGSMTCVKGHSGSGKTTFLNVISGILAPTTGSVKLEGQDLAMLAEAQRDLVRGRKIGFIFQTFNLLPGFSALENVILGSVFAGDPNEESAVSRKRAMELLQKVGLSHREHHRPRMLSSGEQQRVAIARALMNKPRLLLADEPTGSLDETNSGEVLRLIRELASTSGAALLLVTHDPAVMASFDKVLDLKQLNRASH